jgi:hypothetical protein
MFKKKFIWHHACITHFNTVTTTINHPVHPTPHTKRNLSEHTNSALVGRFEKKQIRKTFRMAPNNGLANSKTKQADEQSGPTTILKAGTVESRGMGTNINSRKVISDQIQSFLSGEGRASPKSEFRAFFTVWTFVTRLPGPTWVDPSSWIFDERNGLLPFEWDSHWMLCFSIL